VDARGPALANAELRRARSLAAAFKRRQPFRWSRWQAAEGGEIRTHFPPNEGNGQARPTSDGAEVAVEVPVHGPGGRSAGPAREPRHAEPALRAQFRRACVHGGLRSPPSDSWSELRRHWPLGASPHFLQLGRRRGPVPPLHGPRQPEVSSETRRYGQGATVAKRLSSVASHSTRDLSAITE
jgi:hypothetical protein